MSTVYIVKSGIMDCLTGWHWLNLKAFKHKKDAGRFYNQVLKQIKPEDLEVLEDVEVEEMQLVY